MDQTRQNDELQVISMQARAKSRIVVCLSKSIEWSDVRILRVRCTPLFALKSEEDDK